MRAFITKITSGELGFRNRKSTRDDFWRIAEYARHRPLNNINEGTFKKSIMASLPFVGTLDSDDDVDQLDNESDSEEETEEVVGH